MRHKNILGLIIAIAFVQVVGFFAADTTHALSGSGYFTGKQGNWSSGYGGDVLPGRPGGVAIPGSARNKDGFINFIQGKLNGGARERTGAAFIINTMVGAGTGDNMNKQRNPSEAMKQDWRERIRADNVTLDVVNGDPNKYGRISFYDPGINDTFFTSYNSGPRELLLFKVDGVVKYVVEIPCANPIGGLSLPKSSKWGLMKAKTEVNKNEVKPGKDVKWTHDVWNSGSIGNDTSDVVSGDVYWHNVTGPLPASVKKPNNEVEPDRSFSRKFEKGQNKGLTRTYTFTIPNNAKDGDRYCQRITGSGESSENPKREFKSDPKCVKVATDATDGEIEVACTDVDAGLQTITYSFDDPDSKPSDPVMGRIMTGSTILKPNTTTKSGSFPVSDVDGGITYDLLVKNVGPGSDGKFRKVASTTSVPCVEDPGTLAPEIEISPPTYWYYPNLTGSASEDSQPKKDRINWTGQEFNREYWWDVYELKFKNEPTGSIGTSGDVEGCDFIKSRAGAPLYDDWCKRISGGKNKPFNQGINRSKSTPDPIGTWTCYILRVQLDPGRYSTNPDFILTLRDVNAANAAWNAANPDQPQRPIQTVPGPLSDPRYQYTEPSIACSVSGIDPKIQVWAHDVKAGGDIVTYLRNIGVGPYANNYGSWGEYGVQAGGVIRQQVIDDQPSMASGVGISWGTNTNNQASWSDLTFANTPGFGGFGGLTPASPPTVDGAQSNGLFNADITYPAGTKIVYDLTGQDVTIDGNLIYSNSGINGLISKIPRVVIIANNITITNKVTRIDPWLFATGTIKTCDTDPRSTKECKNPLNFNGPVNAKTILLYRTGGSREIDPSLEKPDNVNPDPYCEKGNCENNGRAALSAPAERFNLRPDAFLSAYSGTGSQQPVATTDKVTELPPRF